MTRIGGLNYQISANTSGFSKAMVSTRSDLRLTKRLMQESKPAAERQAEGLQRLERLYKSGAIDLRAYRYALDRLNKEQREAARAGGGLANQLKSFVSLNPAIVAATVAATAFYAVQRAVREVLTAVNEQLSVMDDTAKSAETLGIGVEVLQRLRFAAEQSDVELGKLDTSLAKMIRTVGEAAQGLGVGQDALRELGIDAAALNRLNPEQQMHELADALALIPNNNDRLRLTMQIFGRGGADMLRFLNLGKHGLRELGGQIRTFSEEDAQGVEDANDAMNRLQHAVTSLAQSLTAELAPSIEGVSLEMEALINNDAMHSYIRGLTENAKLFLVIMDGIINHPLWEGAKIAAFFSGPSISEEAARGKELEQQRLSITGERQRLMVATAAQVEAMAEAEQAREQQAAAAMDNQVNAQQLLSRTIEDTLGPLREQLRFWGLSADEIEYVRLAQAGANAETLYGLRLGQRRREQLQHEQQLRESLQATTAALREQIETWGMSADELQRHQLAQQGAGRAELQYVAALQEYRNALQQRDDLLGGENQDGGVTTSLAQGLVRGSAADLDRNRQLANRQANDKQEQANRELRTANQRLQQAVQSLDRIERNLPFEVEEVHG